MLRRPPATLAVLLTIALGGLTACSGEDEPAAPADAQAVNPYADRTGYADPQSKTSQAAGVADNEGTEDQKRVFSRLASVPQGIWLTPEEHSAGEVGSFVTGVVKDAGEDDQVPTFVVYGIPDRDCTGGFSEGGLSADEYGPWVQEIADGIVAGDSAAGATVVIEPDALASALECDAKSERVALIADAVDTFAAAGVTTYVDGGHSNWVEPADLAPLLREVGVEDVRGFATNVSNFQTDEDEQQYAETLSGLLGGASYVIDSGRNGFGSTGDWCNPPGRAFGTEPTTSGVGAHQDAFVWVKPPGESDGTCNGGPPAGEFWADRALELGLASGW
nr:glycoside hydrolase family 6 protein [Nocardioides sp. MAH-18]